MPTTTSPTLLLAHADRDSRRALSAQLDLDGYTVPAAPTTTAVIETLQRTAPTAILLGTPFVDVHAFDPASLRTFAVDAGLTDVRVRGEELLANWFGWANRTVEATATPDSVPWLWRQYAYRGYLALQSVDRALLEPRLPAGIFYNLIITARAPSA